MHFPTYQALLLATCLTACEGSTTAATSTEKTRGQYNSPEKSVASSTMSDPANPASAPSQGTSPKQGAYRLLGVYDPGLQAVAWAMKVPRDWRVQQSYERQWNGALPTDKVYLSFRSPDGQQQLEYLHRLNYTYADGPTQQQLRAQMQQMGMPPTPNPGELAPMPALAYLQRVLLPQLAQQGLPLRNPSNERQTPPKALSPQATESKASVDGMLLNGRKVRVECRIAVNVMRQGNDTYYGWGAVPSITQISGDLAATYEHTRVAQESSTPNPAWQRKNQALSDRGLQANSAAASEAIRRNDETFRATMQRNHEANMANIARQGAASTARHHESMAAMDQQMADYQARSTSQDHQHEYYVDNAIRGETKYANPTTGVRVKVNNSYNQVYTDNQGRYYGSNTPIAAGSVDWQELQQVALKNY